MSNPRLHAIPLSDLKAQCKEWCKQDGNSIANFHSNPALRVQVLILHLAHRDSPYRNEHDIPTDDLPRDLNERYEELVQLAGPLRSRIFPEVLHEVSYRGRIHYLAWINPDGVDYERERDMYLFDARFIDVNI